MQLHLAVLSQLWLLPEEPQEPCAAQCELDLQEQALMTPCSEQRIRLSEQISTD